MNINLLEQVYSRVDKFTWIVFKFTSSMNNVIVKTGYDHSFVGTVKLSNQTFKYMVVFNICFKKFVVMRSLTQ